MDHFRTSTQQRNMTSIHKHSPYPNTAFEKRRVTRLLDEKQELYDSVAGDKRPKNAKSTYLSDDKEDAINLIALLGVNSRHYKQLKDEKRLYANRNSAKLSRELKQLTSAQIEQDNAHLRHAVDAREAEIVVLRQQLNQFRQAPHGEAMHQLQMQNLDMQNHVAVLQQENAALHLAQVATPSTSTGSISTDTLSMGSTPYEDPMLPFRPHSSLCIGSAPLENPTLPFRPHSPVVDDNTADAIASFLASFPGNRACSPFPGDDFLDVGYTPAPN